VIQISKAWIEQNLGHKPSKRGLRNPHCSNSKTYQCSLFSWHLPCGPEVASFPFRCRPAHECAVPNLCDPDVRQSAT